MRTHRFLALIPALILSLAASSAQGGPDLAAADELTLKAAHVRSDGPALLEFFRTRTQTKANSARIKDLVRRLGDDSFQAREDAAADLVALGAAAVPFLQKVQNDADIEVARRAEHCLGQIDKGDGAKVHMAAARMLARRKPAGAAQALLDYLPGAGSDPLAAEVRTALTTVAVRDGHADPSLIAALGDRSPGRRAAAAEALVQAGAAAELPAVRNLLKDPDTNVRVCVALALARVKEKAAIPVLIQLLGELPQDRAWLVEDVLFRLAEADAPQVVVEGAPEARRRCSDAWDKWWQAHETTVDLARLDDKVLGYTLIVLLHEGIAFELDTDNKPRWQVEKLLFPLDIQVLPGDYVLVAENGNKDRTGGRVTQRDLKGSIVWEHKIDTPLVAQRLVNGNTFIATPLQLIEVDLGYQEVFNLKPPGEVIMRATKLRNGHIACVLTSPNGGSTRFARFDAKGKELQSFPVQVGTSGGRIDVLANHHVIVPEMYRDRVVEYDAEGKSVWEVAVKRPIAAVRLTNGNTLVTLMDENRAVELDSTGKEVWQYKSDSRVNRAKRR